MGAVENQIMLVWGRELFSALHLYLRQKADMEDAMTLSPISIFIRSSILGV